MTEPSAIRTTGFAEGSVRQTLRLEGLVLLIAATFTFWSLGGNFWLYALLLLAPDLAFVAALISPKAGSIGYNIVHSTILPIAGLVLAYATGTTAALPFLLIWLAHIGMDRAVGYGLKYQTGFGHTHLGLMGKDAARPEK